MIGAGAATLGALGVARPAAAAVEPPLGEPEPFSFERLVAQARELAAKPFEARPSVPGWLGDLPIDQHRRIALRPERAIALGPTPFDLRPIHPGSWYKVPVHIALVENGQARELLYDPALFDFNGVGMREALPANLGWAGFRVFSPLGQPGVPEELMTFLGATYFTATARGAGFGVSARGLALNTGLGRPEEFPLFTRFWVTRPADRLDPLTIYALLESPSVIGAYRFDLAPRESTTVQVDSSVFFRADVEQAGIAPVSGMFFFAPNDRSGIDDYRDQVHTADTLAVWRNTGEVLARPLVNPSDLRLSVFGEADPRGFGLLQRERRPAVYGDLADRFDLRPNIWVEPRGAWGKGSIRLIEIPTPDETHDNIVAFWTPEAPIRSGSELRVAYALTWSTGGVLETGLAKVLGTRIGLGGVPGEGTRDRAVRRVAVDFGPVAGLPPDRVPAARLDCGNAACTAATVAPNAVDGGWRVSFEVTPKNGAVELRCTLADGERPLSEIWLYRLDAS